MRKTAKSYDDISMRNRVMQRVFVRFLDVLADRISQGLKQRDGMFL